jgi:hypothetical protein
MGAEPALSRTDPTMRALSAALSWAALGNDGGAIGGSTRAKRRVVMSNSPVEQVTSGTTPYFE